MALQVFEGWDNYFVLLGTASGGLIGLLFVVVTLTANIERERAMWAGGIYMTPNMMHFAVALVVSATAVAPRVDPRVAAVILAVAAAAGFVNAMRTCLGILSIATGANPPHWSDIWCYGGAPAVIYLTLIGAAAGLWLGQPLAVCAIAVLLMVLLLVAIRNAWDLITWMAPRGPDGKDTIPN